MKRFAGTVLLVCILAGGTYAVVEYQPPPKPTAQEDSPALRKRDNGDIPPRSGAPGDKPREVSRESIEYLWKLRKNTPFGTNGFDLAALRAGMGSRREPSIILPTSCAGRCPQNKLTPPGPRRLDLRLGSIESADPARVSWDFGACVRA